MKEPKSIGLKNALVISAFFLANNLVGQQRDLELLPGSDRLEFDERTGIHKLFGNVNFKYQGNTMFCDSAHFHQNQDLVYAYGKVHINKRDTLNLFCDSMYYNGKTKIAKLWGNVRVRDSEYKLTTDTLTYDAGKGLASYRHGGRVESIVNKEVLTSKTASFDPETKNFFFSKEVKYQGTDLRMETDTLRYLYSQNKTFFYGPTHIYTKTEQMYCENGWYKTDSGEGTLQKNASIRRDKDYLAGDTLEYIPARGVSIAKGNVFYRDSTQKLNFRGNYAFNSDSLNYAFITGNALAYKELDDDTVFIHADTLFNEGIDTSKTMLAYYGAKLYSRSFQAISDSISFLAETDQVHFHGNPIVWSGNAELKGDSIYVQLQDSSISTSTIFNRANILLEVEKDTFYNQISGQQIDAFFRDNELTKAIAVGNATTVYFPTEETKTDSVTTIERIGMNRLYAAMLRVDLDSGEVSGVSYIDKPDGMFYPIGKLNVEEQFIPGFKWNPGIRPKSMEDLLID